MMLGNNGITILKKEYNSSDGWYGANIKKAQQITNVPTERFSAEQWQHLSRIIFNEVLKTNFTGGSYVGNVTRSILDWNKKASINTFENFVFCISGKMVHLLKEWQGNFFTMVSKRKQTIRVCIQGDSFHIIVKKPLTSLVLKYSQDYVNMLEKYPGLQCDFMVLGEKQYKESHYPPDTIILEVNKDA